MARQQRNRRYTLIIPGRAYSAKARSASQYQAEVRRIAAQRIAKPLTQDNLSIKIDYFYLTSHKVDGDNLLKTICDALKGVAYIDDGQITDHRVVVHNIASSFTIEEPTAPEIFDLFGEDQEFVAVIIQPREMLRIEVTTRRARDGKENS